MASEAFRRPARRAGPREPCGEIVLAAPPPLPSSADAGSGGQLLTYLPMLAGAGSTALLVSGAGTSPITYLASGMMALSMLGMAAGGMGRNAGARRRRVDGERRDYRRHLAQVRRRVRDAAAQQRACLDWQHPEPAALWCVADGSRLWERRPGDADFLVCRIGRGRLPLAASLIVPESGPGVDLEPVSAAALQQFVGTHAWLSDVPVAVTLRTTGRITVAGPRADARALVRSMLAQLIAFHAPDDLVMGVCTAAEGVPHWEWLKWAPHALSADKRDAAGQVRLIGTDLGDVERKMGGLLDGPTPGSGTPVSGPHVVVVLDGGRVPVDARLAEGVLPGVTVIALAADAGGHDGAAPDTVRIELRDDSLTLARTCAPLVHVARPDRLGVAAAETLARRVSPLHLAADTPDIGHVPDGDRSLAELLGLADPRTFDPAGRWRPRTLQDTLRVPIGVGTDGQPVELDIKESAQGGMGPHGLVVGATGSGKSELLRTIVLGLAATHSSETLNFVLVDFKGGATFASLDTLPHTSAFITNLEDELVLVDRMQDALQGELVRRQQVLRDAGGYASLRDYEQARERGLALDPMPSLFVVVDEFSELLSAKPDFIDLFVMIGRLGRSLGVHLLLASQRLDEGRLRGLDTQLSYRIGLRTFSSAESRVVLGVPDAYELPSAPGSGYLKDLGGGLTRFQGAYASGVLPTEPTDTGADDVPGGRRHRAPSAGVLPYGIDCLVPHGDADERAGQQGSHRASRDAGSGKTVLDILVGRLRHAGPPARAIWLPPLDAPPTLDELLPDTYREMRRSSGGPPVPTLSVPIGILDRPFEQRRDSYLVDLAASHFVVVGRPTSGKSTTLRTLITALALTHTAEQVQFYCLDFGGGTLNGLRELPHVGSVGTRREPERLRRTVAELSALLARREESFHRHQVDSMASYRRLSADGVLASDGFGDAFLVIDGWATVRQDYEDLEAEITRLASRGLGYGIHVVLSAQRWTELRPAMRDLIGNRLELRLGDPAESEFGRRSAVEVPHTKPGRGLSPTKLHFLSALPRIDGNHRVDDLAAGVAGVVARVRDGWVGSHAPTVRMLPDILEHSQLPAVTPGVAKLPIGVDETTLSPVFVDLDAEPHFVVVGDVESGKSNLLRIIARGVADCWTPAEAKIVTFGYRRSLLGAVDPRHELAGVANSAAASGVVAEVVTALRARLSTIQGAPAGAAAPGWTGPRLVLLLDDYELLGGGGNSLRALLDFLPHARDLGLHLVLSRSAGGAGQGMFEPMMRQLREMGTPGLLLSGNRDEGAVLGAVKLEPFPAGRGRLVHRRLGSVRIQTAVLPPGLAGADVPVPAGR